MAKKLTGTEGEDFVVCQICGGIFRSITNTHLKQHNITLEEYKLKYPNTFIISKTSRYKGKLKGENNHRHNSEIDKWIEENTNKHLCACGCGNYIKIERWHYNAGIPKYIHVSHKNKGVPRTDITKNKISVGGKAARKDKTVYNKIVEGIRKAKGSDKIDKWLDDNINKHFCKCGCNTIIPVRRIHYTIGIPEYIHGHNNRGITMSDDRKMKIAESNRNKDIDKFVEDNTGKYFCNCGCNEEIIIERRYYHTGIPEYILGHNTKTEKSRLINSQFMLKKWQEDLLYKEEMIDHWRTYWSDEVNKLAAKERSIEYNKLHPEKGEKHSEDMKEIWSDEDKRERQRITLTEIWNDNDRRDKSSKDNIERLSKLTEEEIMELTFGMRSHWTPDRKEEHNQWQRDRWTPEMREGWSESVIQRFIDHPELRDNAATKTREHWNTLTEDEKIERGRRISARQQGILYEDWDGYADNSRSHLLPINKCIHLNESFIGCHAHHITKSIIINIPAELHNHIKHNMKTGEGMAEINMLTLQYINGCYND